MEDPLESGLAKRVNAQSKQIEGLQGTLRELQDRLRLLERLNKPTRTKKEVISWLSETVPRGPSYLDTIRLFAVRDNLLLILERQGLGPAMMSLWTRAFARDDPGCPLRSFNISPLNLYGFNGKEWEKVTPEGFRTLRQASEQWFLRAIRAEHVDGSGAATQLLQKVLNASSDTSKLRPRLVNYLRRSLKAVKIYEFEP
jgi:hypothetical protein